MTCWKVLGISPTKDQRKITEAWRKLANQTHPDKGGSAQAFQAAKKAYEQAIVQSHNIIEIKRVRTLAFKLTLLASDVINDSKHAVEFYDHKQKVVACDVSIPAWHLAWGKQQVLRVNDVEVSDGTLVTVDITVNIKNDVLSITDNGLLLEPEVLARSALDSESIAVDWQGNHKIAIDKYGQGILYSKGYLLEDKTRANILVRPKYIFY